MPFATRINDDTAGICEIGSKCCPHSRNGRNISGSATLLIDGQCVHRSGDIGVCNCPHGAQFRSTGGSAIFIIDGQPAALVGHSTVCQGCGQSGHHTSGSSIVEVGG